MLKTIEGYGIDKISKRRVKKDGFGLAEASTIEKERQQNVVLQALEKKGYVFGIYKQKELKACYVFERDTILEDEISYPKYDLNMENAWDFVTGHDIEETIQNGEDSVAGETSKEADESKPVKVVRLKEVFNSSVPTEMIELFEKEMVKIFKEELLLGDVKAIIWNERMLVQKQVKLGSMGYVNALPLGLCFGVAIGTALDNIALGICLGMLWGLTFGTIFTSAGKKEEER